MLKRIVLNENGHFVDQYEVDAVFGGAYRNPDGRYIAVIVAENANWLDHPREFFPFDNIADALVLGNSMAQSHADIVYHEEAAWRLRYDIQEIIDSEKIGVVALPHFGVSSFTVEKQKNGIVRLCKITTPKKENVDRQVKRTEIPPEIDVEFYGCVENIANIIESDYLSVTQFRTLGNRPPRPQKHSNKVLPAGNRHLAHAA